MGMHIRAGDAPAYTEEFAAFIAGLQFTDLPAAAVHAASRGLLDWLGCALAASTRKTLDKMLDAALAACETLFAAQREALALPYPGELPEGPAPKKAFGS